MKVMRCRGSYRYKVQRRKKILKTTLTLCLAAVIFVAAVFAVYAVSRRMARSTAEKAEQTGLLKNNSTVELSISRGENRMLTLPDNVDICEVSFESSDDQVVRVDAAGRADGLAEGTATVTATAEGFYAECILHIGAAEEQEDDTEVTTAITANTDVLRQNLKNTAVDPYHITVNTRTNTVTVYTYDEDGNYTVPVRAMVCSCGAGGSNTTPTGEYSITLKRDWAPLNGDTTHTFLYGQYVTDFYGPYLFHSVPYESMSNAALEFEEFNKLGTNASQGCVRLMASDSYWIYKNCPLNTGVSVISADESADPLGKPPTVRQNINNGWDPTDPSVNNPFKGKLPRIIGIGNVTIEAGSDFDPLEGVEAKDICGNIITDRIAVSGRVVTDKPGVYYITYSVTDDFHLSRTATITVTVE